MYTLMYTLDIVIANVLYVIFNLLINTIVNTLLLIIIIDNVWVILRNGMPAKTISTTLYTQCSVAWLRVSKTSQRVFQWYEKPTMIIYVIPCTAYAVLIPYMEYILILMNRGDNKYHN